MEVFCWKVLNSGDWFCGWLKRHLELCTGLKAEILHDVISEAQIFTHGKWLETTTKHPSINPFNKYARLNVISNKKTPGDLNKFGIPKPEVGPPFHSIWPTIPFVGPSWRDPARLILGMLKMYILFSDVRGGWSDLFTSKCCEKNLYVFKIFKGI